MAESHLEFTRPSHVVGRYALYGRLAAGGMATVHLGRLMEPDGSVRTVAVKRLHPQFCKDPEFVAMFIDEARLAARIKHTNVVETLDILTMGQELLLVMEYIRGECFSKLLRAARRKNLEPSSGVVGRIASGMLHGLHAAHEAKDDNGEPLRVVHRDISPQNVMIDVNGVVKVLDFGVAKASARIQITRDGQMKGKLSYMSPEQLQGMPVDRRADVFACGVVLWEALTRRRLFVGEDASDVLRKILRDEVPPPSEFSPELSPEVDRVVARALSKDPDQRYQTAEELAFDVERSMDLASSADVGAWIDSVAGEILGKRERLLQEIERAGINEFSFAADGAGSAVGRGSITDSDTFQRIQSWAEREAARAVADSHPSLVVDLDAEGEQAPTVADARCVEPAAEARTETGALHELPGELTDGVGRDSADAASAITLAEEPFFPPRATPVPRPVEPRPPAFAHVLAGAESPPRVRRLYAVLAAAAVVLGAAVFAIGSASPVLVSASGALQPEPGAAPDRAGAPAARQAAPHASRPTPPSSKDARELRADNTPLVGSVAPVSQVIPGASAIGRADATPPPTAAAALPPASSASVEAEEGAAIKALPDAARAREPVAGKKVARRPTPPRRTAKASPKPTPAATSKADCRQPYWIDEGGIKRVKLACL